MAPEVTIQVFFKMLSHAVLSRGCHNITLYYQYYSKQEGQEMWLLWGEKVLIKEMWLNIYLTEILNNEHAMANENNTKIQT